MPSPPVAVVGVGVATWDEFWLVDSFSGDERVAQASAQVSMGGGPVATALCVLARLGHRCALVDVQGDDPLGTVIVDDLITAGVVADHVQRRTGERSARAVILVRRSDGGRQIVYLPASAGEPTWGAAEDRLLSGAHLLHINGRHAQAARAAVQSALHHEVDISFDGGAGRYTDNIRDLVLASQLRIVARDFARQFTGREDVAGALASLLEPPARLAVITDGVRGSWVAVPGSAVHHEPARTALPLVDTTGCGDVYHGAFLHGWLSGWEPARCAGYASAAAAQNVQGLGGRHVLTGGSSLPLPDVPEP